MHELISSAFAQPAAESAANTAQHSPMASSLFMIAGFILLFYFLMWRPQSKRAKEHRQLMANLTTGDEVITAGGVLGKISRVTDEFVVLLVGEGVEIIVQKPAIVSVLPKGTLQSV